MSNVDKYFRNLYIKGLKGKVLALLWGRIAGICLISSAGLIKPCEIIGQVK